MNNNIVGIIVSNAVFASLIFALSFAPYIGK